MPSSWSKVLISTNIEESVNNHLHEIMDNIEVFLTNGSGLVFQSMVSLDINLSGTLNSDVTSIEQINSDGTNANELNMDTVEQNDSENEVDDENSYEESGANEDEISKNATFGHNFEIDISRIYPRKHRKGEVILDIKETNEKCFLYCVAAALESDKFKSAVEKENPKNYVDFINKEFDIEGIEFPIKICQIQQFVKQNSHLNLSINIYAILDGQVKSVATNITCEQEKSPTFIDLLAVFPHSTQNKSCSLQKGHFMLIKDPCRFFTRRQGKSLKKRLRSRIVCPNCKVQFCSKESVKFTNHRHFCSNKHAQVQDLPNPEDRLEFGKLNIFIFLFRQLNANRS